MPATSKDLDHTLTALSIGNIITVTIRGHPTDLQIAFGILMCESDLGTITVNNYDYDYDYKGQI